MYTTYRGHPDHNHLSNHQNKPIRSVKEMRDESSGEDREKSKGRRKGTLKRTEVNIPVSPSDGVSAKRALGLSGYIHIHGGYCATESPIRPARSIRDAPGGSAGMSSCFKLQVRINPHLRATTASRRPSGESTS